MGISLGHNSHPGFIAVLVSNKQTLQHFRPLPHLLYRRGRTVKLGSWKRIFLRYRSSGQRKLRICGISMRHYLSPSFRPGICVSAGELDLCVIFQCIQYNVVLLESYVDADFEPLKILPKFTIK